jgi:hypothetical protein
MKIRYPTTTPKHGDVALAGDSYHHEIGPAYDYKDPCYRLDMCYWIVGHSRLWDGRYDD